jgi:uncharacterized membrane protein
MKSSFMQVSLLNSILHIYILDFKKTNWQRTSQMIITLYNITLHGFIPGAIATAQTEMDPFLTLVRYIISAEELGIGLWLIQ